MSDKVRQIEKRNVTPQSSLLLLGGAALLCVAAFLFVNARGPWEFVLPFRATKILTSLLVAYAVAVSTILFQTVTENRILTPAIMGFDNLYILIQTVLLFFLGNTQAVALHPLLRFGVEVLLLVLFSLLLKRWLFGKERRSLHLLLLSGVVFGIFFRSLSSFLQRIIDPNEFTFLQDRFFASFNDPREDLLPFAFFLVALVSLFTVRWLRSLDVLLLGRDAAISLGVEHSRVVSQVLILVAVLVSVSTALVGPITFFGLLVAHLAYLLTGTHRHLPVLCAGVLLALIALVGGQFILEQLFQFNTNLRVIIEFIGGIIFIALLLRKGPR